MAIASTTSLLDALRQYHLLEPEQLEEAQSLSARCPDPKALARSLLQRGWLTAYQANQLIQGRGQDLLLGSYVLLERLGEGGMGQVFKARSWKLGRLVALKLIRKDRLDNPDAIRRFQREVRSAAALDHPNIVHAIDADQVGGTHLLVMEYVQGTDLAQLVKKNGPLPVARACEYVRQAALGLQHAYERGMVHRDVKPANLLLTADGTTVKVLDMGLARLDHPANDEDGSSVVTKEGAMMGTPDYVAPEQALESHTVDIRGDLYSLGCTLYYLLTGKVPFPGGTLLQKLNKHQSQEASAVESLRPEVPPGVAAIVRQLMAKRPVDRYQIPAEVAAALASVITGGATESTLAAAGQVVAAAGPSAHTLDSDLVNIRQGDTAAVDSPQRQRRKTQERRLLQLCLVGGPLVLLGVAVMLFLALREPAEKQPLVKPEDTPVVRSSPPGSKGDEASWLKQVASLPAEKQAEAVAARLKELNPGFTGSVTPLMENGVVRQLQLLTDNVTDLSPLKALAGLKLLNCSGTRPRKGKLSDLSPLKGLKLNVLHCNDTQVADLSPLKDMSLTSLECGNTKVSDLSPLKGMKLARLGCWATQVADLSPLTDMPLTNITCNTTKVSDLSPLKDMKLTTLFCDKTKVSDLSPLKGMPLKELWCDFKPERDAELLRSLKTLEKINEKPAAELWKEVDEKQAAFEAWCKEVAALPAKKQAEAVAARLKDLNPGFDGEVTHQEEGGVVTELSFRTTGVVDLSPVRALRGLRMLECRGDAQKKGRLASLWPLKGLQLTVLRCPYNTQVNDLSPLEGMPLVVLGCGYTQVASLAPLKDMKLRRLSFYHTPVTDLSPLKNMQLTALGCHYTEVSDLSPLKGMQLRSLNIAGTPVSDLSPVKGMPLTSLHCNGSKVASLSLLREFPLKELWCDYKPERDAELLRSLKTLETINGKPAQEVLADRDGKKP